MKRDFGTASVRYESFTLESQSLERIPNALAIQLLDERRVAPKWPWHSRLWVPADSREKPTPLPQGMSRNSAGTPKRLTNGHEEA